MTRLQECIDQIIKLKNRVAELEKAVDDTIVLLNTTPVPVELIGTEFRLGLAIDKLKAVQ